MAEKILAVVATGERISGPNGEYTLDALLNDGGQGWIFRLKNQRRVAKIYKFLDPHSLGLQRVRLDRMISSGPPSAAFVWPDEVVEVPSFGYIMRLVEGLLPIGRLSRSEFLTRVDLRTRLRVCYRLVDAFSLLHLRAGYAYCDLSESNILCNPETGEVAILDSDNLSAGGLLPPIVRGTYRLMAPEIESGKQREPNVETDLHSLSVLIFQTLLFHHPLLGDGVHADASLEPAALGDSALYVHHPRDRRNVYTRYRQLGGVPITVLPDSMRRLFEEVFVVGLHNPNLRVRESRWRRELVRQLDTLVRCSNPRCFGKQTFMSTPPSQRVSCVWCGTESRDLLVVRLSRQSDNGLVGHKVVYDRDRLAAHHCKLGSEFDFSTQTQCAQFELEGDLPTLRNISHEVFSYYLPGSDSPRDFPPSTRVRLQPGYRVVFGANGHVAEVLS